MVQKTQVCKLAYVYVIAVNLASLLVASNSYALVPLTGSTVNKVNGTPPQLSLSLHDLTLFGYKFGPDDTNYFEDNTNVDASKRLLSFAPVLRSQLESTEYVDTDGDSDAVASKLSPLNLDWEYFDGQNYLQFSPADNDTFCSLVRKQSAIYSSNKFRLTITGGLTIETKFGLPQNQNYPFYVQNGSNYLPEKKYLIQANMSSCGTPIDYEQIILGLTNNASAANGLGELVGDGFPIKNTNGADGNYPTTGFPNAAFRLQARSNSSSSYPLVDYTKWAFSIENDKNLNFATISNNGTVTFNGPDASDTAKMASNLPVTATLKAVRQGYEDIIYSFVINHWYALPASKTVVRFYDDAYAICKGLPGNYRLPKVLEIVNSTDAKSAPYQFISSGADMKYAYAIGQGLLAEWGNAFIRIQEFPTAYGNTQFSGKIITSEISERNDASIFVDPSEYGRLRDKALPGLPLKGTPVCITP